MSAAQPKRIDPFIPLFEWARRNYKPTPTMWVLRKWCRAKEIVPAPQKVGGEWRVRASATRIPNQQTKRMI